MGSMVLRLVWPLIAVIVRMVSRELWARYEEKELARRRERLEAENQKRLERKKAKRPRPVPLPPNPYSER